MVEGIINCVRLSEATDKNLMSRVFRDCINLGKYEDNKVCLDSLHFVDVCERYGPGSSIHPMFNFVGYRVKYQYTLLINDL